MSQEKYIGLDVHQATIAVGVMDAADKLIMECRRETQASTSVELIQRTARDSVSDLRARNLGCLVTRSLETPWPRAGRLRSATSGSVERGQPE